jgi:hypothetical protein
MESFLEKPPLLSNLDDGASRPVAGGESLQREITVSKNGYQKPKSIDRTINSSMGSSP